MRQLKQILVFILFFNSLSRAGENYTIIYSSGGEVIFDKSFKTKEGKFLIFESTSGDVRIYTSDKPEVRIKIYGDSDVLDRLDLRYSESPDGIKIKVKRVTSLWGLFSKGFYIDYDLFVPRNYNLQINSGGGNVYLKNLSGNIKVKTLGGDVKIEGINGEVSVSTSGGDILLKKINGNIIASTSGGEIRIEEIKGNVNCTAAGGDIRIFSREGSIEAKTAGGDLFIDYVGENKGIKASTVGGDIKIIADQNFEGYLDLSTIGGSIINEFNLTSIYERRASKLEGAINKKEPRVELKTTGGDIKIVKRK